MKEMRKEMKEMKEDGDAEGDDERKEIKKKNSSRKSLVSALAENGGSSESNERETPAERRISSVFPAAAVHLNRSQKVQL